MCTLVEIQLQAVLDPKSLPDESGDTVRHHVRAALGWGKDRVWGEALPVADERKARTSYPLFPDGALHLHQISGMWVFV